MRAALGRLLLSAAAAVALTSVLAGPADATARPYPFGFGATSLAKPVPGVGTYIWVDTRGDDGAWEERGSNGCYIPYNRPPEAGGVRGACGGDPYPSTYDNALRTIQAAARLAHPGDVIVVRGGTYEERLGLRWAISGATPDRPIVLQNRPGEHVVVKGQMTLTNLNSWTISGLKVVPGRLTQNAALVTFEGGSGWSFTRNQVLGSTGYANVIVKNDDETPAKKFRITGNCISQAVGQKTPGTVHNLYVYPGNTSWGGVISNNLLTGARRGANIKAAGAAVGYKSSPGQLLIERNTMLYASTGVVTGSRHAT